MRYLLKILSGSLWLILLAIASSCTDVETDTGVVSSEDSVTGAISINISPLTRSESSVEDIHSLRIILLDKDGKIKTNEYIEPIDIPYTWEFQSTLGKYFIYVIANESSVINYTVDGISDANNESFTEMINKFTLAQSGFEDFINSLYFEPDYTRPIPASCNYELNLEKEKQSFDVYLVPVATKFEINFKNYRNDPVEILNITLSKIADSNYLMANLDESEIFKTVERNTYYWIDWMKNVVDDTTQHPNLDNSYNSNDYINQKWGWITKYEMPDGVDYDSKVILAPEDNFSIDKAEFQKGEDPVPVEKYLGHPFYFPESKYIADNQTNQSYLLEFKIKITGGDSKIISKELTNVHTLFRNTLVNITVEMNTALEEIYVEISPWTDIEPAYGIITPE